IRCIQDEIPFEIPENWAWTRLGSICSKITDGSHNPPPAQKTGYPVISAKNIKDGKICLQNVLRFTDEAGFISENPRTNISFGDIIIGIIGGSIGNTALYLHNTKVIAQRSIAIIKPLCLNIFVRIFFDSSLTQNTLTAKTNGSAQGGVYLGELNNLLIPLPPLAEQHRIVEEVEKLLEVCKRL
ncbi:MAG: restriction endonuclease subunit S, partial [Planctomycetia bacterium]|nr:restriction endonuclease subunit S [Planctomycetia bacterium]